MEEALWIRREVTRLSATALLAGGMAAISSPAQADGPFTVSHDGYLNIGGVVPVDSTADAPVMVLGNTGNLTKTYNRFYGWLMDDPDPAKGTLIIALDRVRGERPRPVEVTVVGGLPSLLLR